MLKSFLDWCVIHRSAILATTVVLQNSHPFGKAGGAVVSAIIALLGG